MEARVKESYQYKTVRALQGREFVKTEWRLVPADLEAEALRLTELEVRVQPTPDEGVLLGDAPTIDRTVTVFVDDTPIDVTATRLTEFIDPPALTIADAEPEAAPAPKTPAQKKGKGKK